RRAEGGRAGEPATYPWLRLVGYALAAMIATGIGAWLIQRRGAQLASNQSKPIAAAPTTTNAAGPRGYSAAIGVGREGQSQTQADAVVSAIANGNFQLDH